MAWRWHSVFWGLVTRTSRWARWARWTRWTNCSSHHWRSRGAKLPWIINKHLSQKKQQKKLCLAMFGRVARGQQSVLRLCSHSRLCLNWYFQTFSLLYYDLLCIPGHLSGLQEQTKHTGHETAFKPLPDYKKSFRLKGKPTRLTRKAGRTNWAWRDQNQDIHNNFTIYCIIPNSFIYDVFETQQRLNWCWLPDLTTLEIRQALEDQQVLVVLVYWRKRVQLQDKADRQSEPVYTGTVYWGALRTCNVLN